jgi:DNA binding domain, excisionase family
MLKVGDKTLLSLREAAKMFNVSVITLSRHVKMGTLNAHRVSGFRVIFVDADEVDRWKREVYNVKQAAKSKRYWAQKKRRRKS